MKDNSIAYQHSTCLPSPNSSLVGQDVNSYSTLMDTSITGRRTRIQPSSLPLSEHSNWIADGTFYVSPRIFPQSYTIHLVVENKCVPLVYILSGDKKGDTYEFVLNVIKHYFDQHCPVDTGTIFVDFEKAVMNAFSNSLPGWEVSNCLFHLCQSVQKNIQKDGSHH